MGSAAGYTQVKVSIDSGIAAAFKAACMAADVSMARVVSDFCAKYSDTATKDRVTDLSTRRKRRAEVRSIVERLEQVKAAEESYRDNIPENLQGSQVFERAEGFVSLLEDVVDLLGSIE
jgi:hypothetical protein